MLPPDARREPMPVRPAGLESPAEMSSRHDRASRVAADHARYLVCFLRDTYLEPAGLVVDPFLFTIPHIGDSFAFWLWRTIAPSIKTTTHPPWLAAMCADVTEFSRLNDSPYYAAVLPADIHVVKNELVWSYFPADICEQARELVATREEAEQRRAEESGY
jgi:hypothetical protein